MSDIYYILFLILIIIGKTLEIIDCNGGVYVNDYHFPCDCTCVSTRGRHCDEKLLPGLILVPAVENANFVLKRESRHAKFIKLTKDGVILYNATTDTVIVIVDNKELKRAVHFDSGVVELICSKQSHDGNFHENLIPFAYHIKCTDDKNNRVHTSCSKLSSAGNVNADMNFIKILAYLNQQMCDERCSMQPNTKSVTYNVTHNVTHNVTEGFSLNDKTTPLESCEKYLASKDFVLKVVIAVFCVLIIIIIAISLFLLNKRYSFIPKTNGTRNRRKLQQDSKSPNPNECDAPEDVMIQVFDERKDGLADQNQELGGGNKVHLKMPGGNVPVPCALDMESIPESNQINI